MSNPLTFEAGSSFEIMLAASDVIDYPAGVDVDASVPNRSFYFDTATGRIENLNGTLGFERGAFLIRANGTKLDAASRLSVNPASGTISPGGSQTVTVTFDAKGLADGDYQGQLSITSNGGNRTVPVRVHVSTNATIAELAYDNGTPTNDYYWSSTGEGSAVRFTPPSRARLKQAKIFIQNAARGDQFNLRVLADANGTPGNTVYGPTPVTVPDTGWVDYDLGAANISVSSDFYIMIEYNGVSEPSFGSEDTPPLARRSWDFDGREWTLFDTEDYLIRAVVEYTTTGVETRDGNGGLPHAFELSQNYPNPFWSEATSPAQSGGNPETSIEYRLPEATHVELVIYDLSGRRMITLESALKDAGEHTMRWNGRDSAGNRVASGIYLYRLAATTSKGAKTTLTKKLTALK